MMFIKSNGTSVAFRNTLAASLILAAVAGTPGVPAIASPAPRAATSPVAIDAARLASLPTFIDGVVAQQIATRQVAGAVVTVVHKGKVLFTRGYGYADIAKRVPVDAQSTLFRPGSVSKLLTWAALMQQVELGKVDLDADVNRYIDFAIPPFEGKPIRVRDLFSHSPGMSDLDYGEPDLLAHPRDYRDYLKKHIPARLWAPGTEISYSNYGAALAGYIVERVSNEPFPDYVDRHLFKPLGMNTTTFREPLPEAWARHMALGYGFKDGRLAAKPYENFSFIMPAGSAAATAPDMARFMLAMLARGTLGGARILSPASVDLLESNSLANAPHLEGMAHGFMVAREATPRMIGHGGNTVDFHSYLLLAPEADFGFFVSTTGGPDSSPARTELSNAIIGRLFPAKPAQRASGEEAPPPLGQYRANRRDYGKPADPAGDLTVSVAGPNAVITKDSQETLHWERIGPHLYERVTGARDGGPYDRLEFYGSSADPRLSFASSPHQTWHLVKP
ncbi:MAG: serine hydrolase domain-containing protein [Pseudomonadota bacterium]|jgi:CubicO group peptidase (beta-lactamase class C family)